MLLVSAGYATSLIDQSAISSSRSQSCCADASQIYDLLSQAWGGSGASPSCHAPRSRRLGIFIRETDASRHWKMPQDSEPSHRKAQWKLGPGEMPTDALARVERELLEIDRLISAELQRFDQASRNDSGWRSQLKMIVPIANTE